MDNNIVQALAQGLKSSKEVTDLFTEAEITVLAGEILQGKTSLEDRLAAAKAAKAQAAIEAAVIEAVKAALQGRTLTAALTLTVSVEGEVSVRSRVRERVEGKTIITQAHRSTYYLRKLMDNSTLFGLTLEEREGYLWLGPQPFAREEGQTVPMTSVVIGGKERSVDCKKNLHRIVSKLEYLPVPSEVSSYNGTDQNWWNQFEDHLTRLLEKAGIS